MTRADDQTQALHIATYSGWYRFEKRDQQWIQTDRALTFWKMTSLQVDPEDARHLYIATEHSGLFITDNGGADWQRAKPNVPRLTTTSLLALPGMILAGTVPAALYYREQRQRLAGAGRCTPWCNRRQLPSESRAGSAHPLSRRGQ